MRRQIYVTCFSQFVVVAIFLAITAGCVSYETLSRRDDIDSYLQSENKRQTNELQTYLPRLFSGAFIDIWVIAHGFADFPGVRDYRAFHVLDLPFSLALDTIVLPWTIFDQLVNGNLGVYKLEKTEGIREYSLDPAPGQDLEIRGALETFNDAKDECKVLPTPLSLKYPYSLLILERKCFYTKPYWWVLVFSNSTTGKVHIRVYLMKEPSPQSTLNLIENAFIQKFPNINRTKDE